jgi:hypothetical protein
MYGDIPTEGITIRVPNPPKTAFLRLPTNQEMLERLDQQKSIRRTIGRRKSQTEFVPNLKADLDLFCKIRLDKDGAEFDEFEAGNAISKLTFCEVTDCQRAGDEYRVTLRTPFRRSATSRCTGGQSCRRRTFRTARRNCGIESSRPSASTIRW